MDGVLADASGRQHHLEWPQRDWETFFELCGEDAVVEPVVRLLDLLDPALRIVLLTARPIRVQTETLRWLAEHELRWDLLVMRHWGDYGAAQHFKSRSVAELRRYGFDCRLAFEDDPRNVDMFDAAGIPCVYIHSGYHA